MASLNLPTSSQFQALRLSIDNHFARHPRQTRASRERLLFLVSSVFNVPAAPGCPLYFASNASSPSLVITPLSTSPSPTREPTYALARSNSLPLSPPHILDETFVAVDGSDCGAIHTDTSDLCYNGQGSSLDAIALHSSKISGPRHSHRRSSVIRMQETYATYLSLKEAERMSKFGARALAKARRALTPRRQSEPAGCGDSQAQRRGSVQSIGGRKASISSLSLGGLVRKVRSRGDSIDERPGAASRVGEPPSVPSLQEERSRPSGHLERHESNTGLLTPHSAQDKGKRTSGELAQVLSNELARQLSQITVVHVGSPQSDEEVQKVPSQNPEEPKSKATQRLRAATTSDGRSLNLGRNGSAGRARAFSIKHFKSKLSVLG
ncbi:MAG: hypothetical protein M1814_000073 [Vezdaea aestivalis]|nr:MAG: hypothetical protein M1814_000073 [Vezdaea aestivalis]